MIWLKSGCGNWQYSPDIAPVKKSHIFLLVSTLQYKYNSGTDKGFRIEIESEQTILIQTIFYF